MKEISVQLQAIQHPDSGRTEVRVVEANAPDKDESVLCSMIVHEASALNPAHFLALLLAAMRIQHADLRFSLTQADVENALKVVEPAV